MQIEFIKLDNSQDLFFNILPQDWQDIIVPQWKNFKDSASIFIFKENEELIAGGIVFEKSHINMTPFEKEHQYLYAENYFYLGFIWVIPSKRNQQLASKWLTEIKKAYSNQKFWLTIEEEPLKYFYQKNDFKLIAESNDENYKEWVLTFTPQKF